MPSGMRYATSGGEFRGAWRPRRGDVVTFRPRAGAVGWSATLVRGVREPEASRHPNSIGIAHHAIGVVYLLQGDWTNALGSIEHAISLYRAGHFVMVTRTAICSSSWALAQLGDASQAEGRLEEGEQLIERYSASGVVGYLGWTMYSLGRACLLLGRLDQAQALAEHAIAAVPEHTGVAAYARHLLGDVATHPDLSLPFNPSRCSEDPATAVRQ
jgi:tetratricopeptide (TPR) repeat protein